MLSWHTITSITRRSCSWGSAGREDPTRRLQGASAGVPGAADGGVRSRNGKGQKGSFRRFLGEHETAASLETLIPVPCRCGSWRAWCGWRRRGPVRNSPPPSPPSMPRCAAAPPLSLAPVTQTQRGARSAIEHPTCACCLLLCHANDPGDRVCGGAGRRDHPDGLHGRADSKVKNSDMKDHRVLSAGCDRAGEGDRHGSGAGGGGWAAGLSQQRSRRQPRGAHRCSPLCRGNVSEHSHRIWNVKTCSWASLLDDCATVCR